MHPLKHRRPLQAAAFGLAVISTLAFSGLLSPRPIPRYAVTDLGVLPGYASSRANAVNSRGGVVGSIDPLGGDDARAYLYQNGRMTSLGALPGGSRSDARGINSRGEVTGRAWLPTGNHAFVYSGGKMRDLGTLPGFHDSTGVGINDWGEVAVNATSSPMQPGPPQGHVFLYRAGRMTEIRMPSGCSEMHALSINDAGQIAGDCHWTKGPFLYDSRTKTMTILSVPAPYLRGWVSHINESGQVIGDVSLPGGSCHATLWRGSHMTDLGAPSGYPISVGEDLNNRGEAVGNCFIDPGSFKGFLSMHAGGDNVLRRYLERDTEHAFVYRGGKIQDLNNLISKDADWTLEEARGINDRGQIVGRGLHDGQQRGFLLTPR